MSSEITISPAAPEDAAWIAEAQIAMAWESEKMKLDPKVCRAGVSAVLTDPARGRYFLARTAAAGGGGDPIACVLLQREWSDWRNGWVGWIHSVYVRPESRGRRVWAAMYEWLKTDCARDPGFRGFRLYVERANDRARAVYRKLGMSCDHYELYEWMK